MKARDWAVTIAAVLVIVVLSVGMWSAITGRSVTHGRLEQRLIGIDNQVAFLTCIVLVPDAMRADAVAECQSQLDS